MPLLRATDPRVVDPSSKVTVPVGTPVAGLTTLTIASSVTAWPRIGVVVDAVTAIWVVFGAMVTSS
jgi:hypothetical protein